MKSRRRAFTLAELVVVLLVMLVLAALLFPTFDRARQNARRSSCQSNLKQLAMGFSTYCRDYDERTLPVFAELNGVAGFQAGQDEGWAQSLLPYVKNPALFRCPSGRGPQSGDDTLVGTDYWHNLALFGLTSAAAVDQVHKTILFGEGDNMTASASAFHLETGFPPLEGEIFRWDGQIFDPTGQTEGRGAKRHLEGANYAFFDGHVKWLKPDQVSGKSAKRSAFTFAIE